MFLGSRHRATNCWLRRSKRLYSNMRGVSMRSAARLKMGYYPLPESEGVKLRSLLSFE